MDEISWEVRGLVQALCYCTGFFIGSAASNGMHVMPFPTSNNDQNNCPLMIQSVSL